VAVKDWRKIIARQGNATSDMSGVYDSGDYINVIQKFESKNLDINDATPDPSDVYTRTRHGFMLPAYTFVNPSLGVVEASNRASIAFLKKCRAIQSEFSSPTVLGELRETLRMIRHPAQGLRNLADRYLSDVRKHKKKAPKNWKKNLSSMWLEHAFGWTPLLHDVAEGYKAYSSLVKERDNEQLPVTAVGIEEKLVTTTSQRLDYDPFFVVVNDVVIDRALVKFYGMVVRRVDATLRDKLARVGFNAEEFIPTVWELLPWSFLIDYFTNIGDVLTANSFNRAELAWVAQTQVRFRIRKSTMIPETPESVAKRYGKWFVSASRNQPAFATEIRRVVTRTAAGVLPSPTISLELPGRPAQWANMLALFAGANSIHTQRFRR
jgi:hypothetical protein